MITEFGKEIRKLRIDKSMTLTDMAKRIKFSVSHVSSIETGHRNITRELLKIILSSFKLKESEKKRLTLIADRSNNSVKINLANSSLKSRQLALCFSQKFKSLRDDDIKCLQAILNNYD